MPVKRSIITVLALALATVSLQAGAHRAWIKPALSHVEGGNAWVTVDGAISDDLFEIDHMPLKLDGLVITAPDGASVPAPTSVSGRQRTSFDLNLAQSGTYRISVVTATVMASYKDAASGETKRFRGSREAFEKEVPAGAAELVTSAMHSRLETWVSANKASSGALKPSGVGLEMVPLTNPTELVAGETAKWRFQLDGKPLPNFAFSLIPGGVRYRGVLGEMRLVTDTKGEVSVKLPVAGAYWLNARFPVASEAGGPEQLRATGNRYSYAATFDILPD
ncbi:MAG: DUF4198 domain-containing protein [Massilia sp.]